MKVTFDAEADAAYIRLAEGAHGRTVVVDGDTNVDLDPDGRLLGIEVLAPGAAWPLAEILRRWDVGAKDAAMLMELYPLAFSVTVT